MMGVKIVLFVVFMLMSIHATFGEDLYELLGVRASISAKDLKRVYRKLALKYHPDKLKEGSDRKAMEAKFLKIANAYKVISNPERRKKYDLYGIADEEGFKNFDDAMDSYHSEVEDSYLNWALFGMLLGMGALPFILMNSSKKKVKKTNKQRDALLKKKN